MAELAKDWFESTPAPRGPDSPIGDYVSSPPRGMTNAPQNPRVRARLLQDLADYGIASDTMHYPTWPPPAPCREQPPAEHALGALSRTSPKNRCTMVATNSRISALYGSGMAGRPVRKQPLLWSGRSHDMVPYSRGQDIAYTVAGRPTAFWRPNKISLESSSSAPQLRHPEKDQLKAFPRQSLQGFRRDRDKGPPASANLTEEELRNAREVLKGQQSLHVAAVQDRFKFAADLSPGAPVVIRGAGTAQGVPACAWESEASYLVNFHRSAIRTVAPSGLTPVKETPKRKKKKKKMDDIEDLQLSESGLFVPKYPIDESLKSLRRLKKNMFPDVVRREQEDAAAAAYAFANAEAITRQNQAAFFATTLNSKASPESTS